MCERTAEKVHNPILSQDSYPIYPRREGFGWSVCNCARAHAHFLGRGDLKGTKWPHKFGAQWHSGGGGMICYTNFRVAAASETSGGEREALGAVAERLRRIQQLQTEEGRGGTTAERENRSDDQKGDVS